MDGQENRGNLTCRAKFALLAAMVAAALWLAPPAQAQEATADCGDGNPLHQRTQKVVDAILAVLSADDCSAVTSEQLAGITTLNLDKKGLTSLLEADFAGFRNLENLHLNNNELTALPEDVFSDLTFLQNLSLNENALTALPEDVFNGRFLLMTLSLNENALTALPVDLFASSGNLNTLRLNNNALTALPEDVFDGLSSLRNLHLNNNDLTALPSDVFDGLTNLENLHLNENELAALHKDAFDGLSRLRNLHLNHNELTALPEDVFDGLSKLRNLHLNNNELTALPDDVFADLAGLRNLHLNDMKNDSLDWLSPDAFAGLSNLEDLHLGGNRSLTCIHAGQFNGLPELRLLRLDGAGLGNIDAAYFTGWELDNLAELRLGTTNRSQVYAIYRAVLPALKQSDTYVRDTADMSHPICGSIEADRDDNGYHRTVRVSLEGDSVYPNRVRSGASGDGVCGSDARAARHVLWTWQRSADGVTWTDMASDRQPKGYGDRVDTESDSECSFAYTPQSDDDDMYVRAYVTVNTLGVGENTYHSAVFGPLNVRP